MNNVFEALLFEFGWQACLVDNLSTICDRSRSFKLTICDNLDRLSREQSQGHQWQLRWWQSLTTTISAGCQRTQQSRCGMTGQSSTMRTRLKARSSSHRTTRIARGVMSLTMSRHTGLQRLQWQNRPTCWTKTTRSTCCRVSCENLEIGNSSLWFPQQRKQSSGLHTINRWVTQWRAKTQSCWQ